MFQNEGKKTQSDKKDWVKCSYFRKAGTIDARELKIKLAKKESNEWYFKAANRQSQPNPDDIIVVGEYLMKVQSVSGSRGANTGTIFT